MTGDGGTVEGWDGARVGFIGLGVMGAPMCRNLLAGLGAGVTVFDIRADAVDGLVAQGAVAAGSVAGVVERADLVLLSLPDGDALDAVVAGHGGMLGRIRPGQIVVDHSTAPVGLTRELAARCRDAGADYCDAPIARTRQAAVDGTLSIMVGGRAATVERIRPVLATMASDVTHCGEVGAGQITKLLNNMLLFQNVRALAEAHAVATGLGVDVDTVFDVIADASGGSFALANHGRRAMFPGDYPTRAFSIRYAIKDLGYALDLAAEVGVDAEGARSTLRLLEAARDAGHGDEYFPVLRRLL